ncbi:MAG: 30S ribosomal protein S20 [Planctomycetes bacterium]|nr:30S ribosomal protein S20 [Planctomycetota bacterium]
MANNASAKKRIRQSLKRTLRNRVRKERLKKVVKGFNKALESKDSGVIGTELKKVSGAIDKAGKKGLLHKNAVNRKKSRLAKAANKALA